MFRASVCIATYRRPGGLHDLLASLSAQKDPPPFEVIVVDNDREGTAASIVEGFSDRLSIRYLIEPDRGLARVRNRAVAESRGDFLAFIDDDEIAVPGWLATLDRVLSSTKAAAVFGAVDVTFDPETPQEIRNCELFKQLPVEEGAPLQWFHARTSNAYVDRAALPPAEPPFRILFDRTGGEDSDLFFRMAKAGAKFAYAGPEAAVIEYREKTRSDIAWVVRRSLRNGGNQTDLWDSDRSMWQRAHGAAGNFGRAVAAWAAALKAMNTDRDAYIGHVIAASQRTGRFLRFFGYCYNEYGR